MSRPISPVGNRNAGYLITSAVRLQSVGIQTYSSEDMWVVLGHNPRGEMVCWTARLVEFDDGFTWSFSGGTYVNRENVWESFHGRIKFELEMIFFRSEASADQIPQLVGGEE
tara:strand:+ start:7218 stop:7553 length:336 start_codon:yes stop_codon:yes gene_type:complete